MSGIVQAPYVLTGADQLYWRSLAQFLLSAERQAAHRRYRWIVFDLGMESATLDWMQRRFDWCDWRRVPFDDLAPHYRVEIRSFAWKPWAIWQIMQNADAPLLWLDSATIIRTDLDEVFDWLRAHGVYAAHGRSAMRDRCEPAVMDRLGFPRALDGMRETVANVVGFDPGHDTARHLAQEWEVQSRVPDLLLPKTASVERHMNDQAVLNCLMLPMVASGALQLPGVDADICAGRPYQMISTRNKVPPWLPIWADPFARLYHWTYKTVDQALWRRADRKAAR